MAEIPLLEEQETMILANYLRLNNYIFTHIANEVGQWGTKNIIAMMAKKKRMGVSKGVPDFMIILKRKSLLFIELKRSKKELSKITKEQKEWIDALNEIDNVSAVVAYGAKEAIEIINKYENL